MCTNSESADFVYSWLTAILGTAVTTWQKTPRKAVKHKDSVMTYFNMEKMRDYISVTSDRKKKSMKNITFTIIYTQENVHIIHTYIHTFNILLYKEFVS